MPFFGERILAPDGERQDAAEQGQTIGRLAEGALSQTGYHTLRSVVCEFDGGTLVLRGRVSSLYMKQVANTAVSKVEGIVVIDNQMEVTQTGYRRRWKDEHQEKQDVGARSETRSTDLRPGLCDEPGF